MPDLKRLVKAAVQGCAPDEVDNPELREARRAEVAVKHAEMQAQSAINAERVQAEREALQRTRELTWQCRAKYQGGTASVPGLKPVKACTLASDPSGLTIRAGRTVHLVAWDRVTDIRVEDASRMHVNSGVRRVDGGIGAPLGATQAVARTNSRWENRCYVELGTAGGAFLFLVFVEGRALEGRFMLSRELWTQTAAPFTATVDDPVESLKKLADLHAAGVLTEAEFSAKKAELLARI